jgi:glutamate 5-kinase
MSSLTDQISALYHKGIEVIIVSSGAVASGRSEVTPHRKLDSVDQRQLFSSVGQVKLINRYYEFFSDYHIVVGQVLTMKENFSTRRLYLNQKNCMEVMLRNGVIPIVNENDTISVTELMFTDNDELSGLIASMMNAQALFILSNIDGIYDGSPSDSSSHVIRTISPDMDLSKYIQTGKSSFGRGGMLTKSNIAHKIAEEGIDVVIANGKRDNILIELMSKPSETICTRFEASDQPVSSIKKWIAHSEGFAKGEIHINDCLTARLSNGVAASILPIGINGVEGDFEKDDIVRIVDCGDQMIGCGKVNCSSEVVRSEMGKHGKRAVVHYDYLYIE